MLLKNLAAVLGATVALAGTACIGDVSISQPGDVEPGPDDNTPPPTTTVDGDNEQVLFDNTVAPILSANCGTSGCHDATAPVFVQGGVAQYDLVMANPELYGNFNVDAAMILTQEASGHYGVVFTEDEKSAVEFWIQSEAAHVSGTTTDLPATNEQVLAEFSGCMTKDNWDASNMGDWANHRAGGEPCASCHAGGGGGLNTNPDSDIMFEKNRQYEPNAFILGFFQVQPNEITGDLEVVPARTKLMTQAQGGGPGSNHPFFTYEEGSEYYLILEDFYSRTMQYMQDNPSCKEIGFPPAN